MSGTVVSGLWKQPLQISPRGEASNLSSRINPRLHLLELWMKYVTLQLQSKSLIWQWGKKSGNIFGDYI